MQTPHGKLSVIFTDPPILLTCSVISESPLCFDRSADDRVSASAVPLSFMRSIMIPLSWVRVIHAFSPDDFVKIS